MKIGLSQGLSVDQKIIIIIEVKPLLTGNFAFSIWSQKADLTFKLFERKTQTVKKIVQNVPPVT